MKLALLLIAIGLSGCTFFLKSDENKVSNYETKVHYISPSHEELNSFAGYFRKETRPAHFAETKFDLDASQQVLILNRAFLTKFFELPHVIPSASASEDTSSLRIASGIFDWTVKWTASPDELKASGSKLPELLAFIDSTVHSTRAYKQLPKREQ